MLTRPAGLSDDALARALKDGWAFTIVSIQYQPVGFGSHHWEVVDRDGVRRFVTVDDVQGSAFGRLRAALATAVDLRDSGATFMVAPIPTRAGEPLVRANERFGVALYPYVDGQSYAWGDFATPAHRCGVLDMIVVLHEAPKEASRHAVADDFAIPHRDELESTADHSAVPRDSGPFARLTNALLVENAERIRRLLLRYDDLVKEARVSTSRRVVTHGEPHPGNTMLTSTGWVLIDWDTVMLAPPERDLWSLDPGDGSILAAYADATGTTPRPQILELYRIRWDLADLAVYVSRFQARHSGNLNDEKSWEELRSLVRRLPA